MTEYFDELAQDMDAWKRGAARAHATIDRHIAWISSPVPPYSSALDEPGIPAPLDLSPKEMSLDAIRDRHATGEGDRRQLLADRAWLLAEVDRADGVRP